MKYISTLLLLTFSLTGFSQEDLMKEAQAFHQMGDLSSAKSSIDQVVTNDATKNNGQAWYFYGVIYGDIYTSNDSEALSNPDSALPLAVDALNKAIELGPANFGALAELALTQLGNGALTKGVTAYSSGNYELAIKRFRETQIINPKDTTAYIYAGIAAQEMGNYDEVMRSFTTLTELDYNNPDIYLSLIYYSKNIYNDLDASLEWARKARKRFPNETEFMKHEVNLLIQTGQAETAKAGLLELLETEPENANLWFNLGYLNEDMGNMEEALRAYKKSIEVNPEYFDAVYNLAVYYFNQAADIYGELDDMDQETYEENKDDYEERAEFLLEKSLPYFQQASALRPEEAMIWNTLSLIYNRLDMEDEAEEAHEKYIELRG
ncbi:tetratricopeptide repeat protein [Phaeocystidibacter luteus]|uniref:Tetratricopeptide repeat protein n=1 Tax=Phaeocystidibacter luteus TaxID=911197 RepID=A0A6N6RM40_9FLAO|nr:tetratricopeptide repeat protein [Phaeocystidibacter luteus]KAB2814625.1 tetratricopeptide repeat protein [Phaeocystidibacter luteus]